MSSDDELSPIIDRNELVFYTDKGNIQSGGYRIDNILMNNDIPAMKTTNGGNKNGKDDSVSSIFKDLAIPAGLLYLQQPDVKKYPQKNSGEEVVEDSLYNRLLKIVDEDAERTANKPRKKTKHRKVSTKQRKTKRHY